MRGATCPPAAGRRARAARAARGAAWLVAHGAALACGTGATDRPGTVGAADAAPSTAALAAERTPGEPETAATSVRIGRFAYPVAAGTRTTLTLAELDSFAISPMELRGDSTPAQVWAAGARPGARRVAPDAALAFAPADPSAPEVATAEGYVDRGPASVWVRRIYAPGREADVVAGLKVLAASYARTDSSARAPAPVAGFVIPGGVFARPLSAGEVSGAVLEYPADAALQSVVVRTGRDPRPDEPGGLIAEWRAKAADPSRREPGTRVTVLSARRRTVAGLEGEEVVARLTPDGGAAVLALEWESPGKGGEPSRPYVRLAATADAAQEARAVAAWGRLLDGTRQVTGAPRAR